MLLLHGMLKPWLGVTVQSKYGGARTAFTAVYVQALL
jgi:hypothetical protein